MASGGTLVIIPAHIVSKTGPRIVGYLLHWGLFGVLCMQVYLYYLGFPRDPRRNKIFVSTVFFLELVQTAMVTQTAFKVFGSEYGRLSELDSVGVVWFSVPIISGLVAFIAEIFYAIRIKVLFQSNRAAGVIAALAVIQLMGAIATAVVTKKAALFSRILNKHFFITASIWNGGSALCDLIIAGYMTYHLSRRRNASGRPCTQMLLQKIIRLVIETGAITAAISILNLILALLPKHPSYFETTSDVLAKVYSNSMMVVLNSRLRATTDSDLEFLPDNFLEPTSERARNVVVENCNGSDTETVDTRTTSGVLVTRERIVFSETGELEEEGRDVEKYLSRSESGSTVA